MYFTLAVSAATAAGCAALVRAALDADPRIMPVPGPARAVWRAPDGSAAVLHWGRPGSDGTRPNDRVAASHAGTWDERPAAP